MKKDIIIAGVGGQGILSIAAVIGTAALLDGLNIKQSEVHGMSQRGGAVVSHLRISSEPIYSDLIPYGKADMILSVEPMEALRYLPYLAEDGIIVSNTKPYVNIPDYPPIETVLEEIKSHKNSVLVDADKIARNIRSPRSSNIVMVGASSHRLDISFEKLEEGIRSIFGRKGETIVNLNLEALKAGRDAANNFLNKN